MWKVITIPSVCDKISNCVEFKPLIPEDPSKFSFDLDNKFDNIGNNKITNDVVKSAKEVVEKLRENIADVYTGLHFSYKGNNIDLV